LTKRFIASLGAVLLAAGTFLAPGLTAPTHAATSLVGAGSSFDFPFFDKAFHVYQSQTGVSINYQPIGSGAGIQQFAAKTVDFGATDVPASPSDLKTEFNNTQQIPITLGGVAMAYNVPGVKTGLHLTGRILADIYLGYVTKWNDQSIRALNKRVKLPSLQITPVYRSDGSGTSYAFTDYLSKVDDTWRGTVGTGKLPQWPTGVGQKGNQGIAATVQGTSGAIGYVELAYVLQNHMKYAALQNRSGKWVTPSLSSVAADASAFPKISERSFSIADGQGAKAYPIATYSWVLLSKHQTDKAKGKELVNLFRWMLTTGQKYAKQLQYVPLPKKVTQLGLTNLKTIK
jgi:phosphate transport system substrate-binding protein